MTTYVRLEEQPITADLKLTDDLFIKTVIVQKAGTVIPQHAHRHSHVTLICVGTMRIWANDVLLGDYTGPVGVLIEAEVKHRMETLTDGVVFACIHALHGTDDVEIHEEHELEMESP